MEFWRWAVEDEGFGVIGAAVAFKVECDAASGEEDGRGSESLADVCVLCLWTLKMRVRIEVAFENVVVKTDSSHRGLDDWIGLGVVVTFFRFLPKLGFRML
uniref:Uncharacterized protein n=1 Tax=Kalanchoe fedtschenkoi TaxID=63787 RepID=A0A7N0TKV5_KALFE